MKVSRLNRSQQTIIFQKEIWKVIRHFAAEFDLEFTDVLGVLEMTKLDIYRMEVNKFTQRKD